MAPDPDSLVLYILYCGGFDVYSTKYGTRLNKQYDVHIFIVTGWQICQLLNPGFLPRCSYILARHNTLFTPPCISLLFASFSDGRTISLINMFLILFSFSSPQWFSKITIILLCIYLFYHCSLSSSRTSERRICFMHRRRILCNLQIPLYF